jgi:mono/diheme cytochrome c family protein
MKNRTLFPLAFVFSLLLLLAIATSVSASPSYQDEQLQHGKYIASIAGCPVCHTPYKAEYQDPTKLSLEQIQVLAFNESQALDQTKLLAGGRVFPLGPIGNLLTRNLTPDKDTGLGSWTDEQVKLAVKTGVDNNGEVLFPVMPYHVYNGMADADVNAVVAYLRSVNAVKNEIPKRTISTEGMPSLPYKTGIVAPDASDKAARGAYLVNSVMGCTDCHTPVDAATGAPEMDKYLAGRQPYEGPWGIVYGGNITPDNKTGLGAWTDDEVKRALLTGVRKDGRRLILMPWFVYSNLTAEDADAVVYYLKNVLPAVNNEVPVASLNKGFEQMAPEGPNQVAAGSAAMSPIILVVVGIGVILLVSLVVYVLRRKSA